MIDASHLKVGFSTEGIPERDRLEQWRELFAKAVVKLEWSPLITERAIDQKATVHRVPGLGIVEGERSSTGNRTRLTPELIAGADDSLALNILTTGTFTLSQLGRATELGPGDAVLGSCCDIATTALTPHGRFVALSFPRAKLAPLRGRGGCAV